MALASVLVKQLSLRHAVAHDFEALVAHLLSGPARQTPGVQPDLLQHVSVGKVNNILHQFGAAVPRGAHRTGRSVWLLVFKIGDVSISSSYLDRNSPLQVVTP